TGASGGVGSLAVGLLAARGYQVIASSGTPAARPLLERLGAASVVPRGELGESNDRPLGKAEFGGGVDTVGGETLANLLKRTRNDGAVAACGLVGGSELKVSVFPFILRGVALLGVDSQQLPADRRAGLWRGLADAWVDAGLNETPGLVSEVSIDELEGPVAAILAGQVAGRVVVRVGGRKSHESL
ncbi:MAG TPA: zinc-binding dehydrogenase, partial [Trueperaceae bacterium]|nr:zinc-binding dehydrogenase [Trueperaceae bacterium]